TPRHLLSDRRDSRSRDDRPRHVHGQRVLGDYKHRPYASVVGSGPWMVARARLRRPRDRRRGPPVPEEHPRDGAASAGRLAAAGALIPHRGGTFIYRASDVCRTKGWDPAAAVPQRALAGAGDGMKKFATELRGKTVMTNDGQILGTIENFIVNTKSGKLSDVLVLPAENVPRKGIKTDPEGRLILPFQGMRAVKDVVVMNL